VFFADQFSGIHCPMPDLISFLRSVPLFAGLSDQVLAALAFLDAPARLARVLLELDRQASADGFVTIKSGDKVCASFLW
jgi:hypothetical protein